MTEIKKLFKALTSDPAKKHKDIKFTLGEQATDVEEIARQCREAIEQDRKGLLKHY